MNAKSILLPALAAAALAAAPARAIKLPVYGECNIVDVVDCTKEDHRFADFPAVPGFVWNDFLLESFLRRESRRFRLFSASSAAKRP